MVKKHISENIRELTQEYNPVSAGETSATIQSLMYNRELTQYRYLVIIRRVRKLLVPSQPPLYSRGLMEGKNAVKVINVRNPSLRGHPLFYTKEVI